VPQPMQPAFRRSNRPKTAPAPSRIEPVVPGETPGIFEGNSERPAPRPVFFVEKRV
jgi:hypothetical protein